MSERLNGKTAWEFACGWYTPDQIAYSIKNRHRPPSDTVIPDDIDSVGFAQWLTEQYRLAMAKGIQIAQQDSHERLAAAEAELECERARRIAAESNHEALLKANERLTRWRDLAVAAATAGAEQEVFKRFAESEAIQPIVQAWKDQCNELTARLAAAEQALADALKSRDQWKLSAENYSEFSYYDGQNWI